MVAYAHQRGMFIVPIEDLHNAGGRERLIRLIRSVVDSA